MLFNPRHKSITCAILGPPNVGKSSLINTLFGHDLSMVSPLAQTTRNRFHCIFTVDHTEVILVDTPGLHQKSWEINKRMNQQAREGAEEAHVSFLLVDVSWPPSLWGPYLMQCAQSLKGVSPGPIWPLFTKMDVMGPPKRRPPEFTSFLETFREEAKALFPTIGERHFLVSAKTGEGLHLLMGAICDMASKGPHRYRPGKFSDKGEDFFMAEYIREQAFELLKDEVPYEVAVTVDEWEDYRDQESGVLMRRVSATILVNRPSQRAIVIGRKGTMIKEIGTRARKRIEKAIVSMKIEQIHLNLHVKVAPRWFRNNMLLEELGLPRVADSIGIWRKK